MTSPTPHLNSQLGIDENLLRVNEELRKRNAELEALFELAPVGLAIARDTECKRIDPNPEMRRLLRLNPEENASRTAPADELPLFRVLREGVEVIPENLPMQVVARTGEAVIGSQCHVVFPNGEFVHLLGSSTPLFDADGKPRGCIGAFLEITAHKQLEQDLREARRIAEQAIRARDLFLATLSHELRSPMNTIVMLLDIWRLTGALPRELDVDLQMLRRNTDMLSRLIDDLLDVERISNGKLTLNRRSLDLHTVVANTLESHRQAVIDKGLTLKFVPGATDHLVHGDATRLQQVIGNVLNNAVKFTQTGEIVVTTSNVDMNCKSESGRFFRVLITDTGIGFSGSAETLFKHFEQGDSQTTQRFGGLGLGLAICKGFIEAHHGSITAASDGPNLGTAITIDLPVI